MKIILLLISINVFAAGGYEKPSLWSSKAASVGGAMSSFSEGSDALFYNPARIFARNHELSLDISITKGYISSAFTEDNKTIKSKTETLPAFGISYVHQYSDKLSFGFGIHPVGGISTHYEDISYSHMGYEMSKLKGSPYSELSVVEFNLITVAAKHKKHQFGLSLTGHVAQGAFSSYTEGYAVGLGGYGVSDGTALSLSNVELHDLKGSSIGSYNLGWSYDYNNITFGVSYRSETFMKTKGKAKGYLAYTNTGSALTNAITAGAFNPVAGKEYSFTESDSEVSTYLPQRATLSSTFHLKKNKVLLEASWTEYSKNKTLQISNTSLTNPNTNEKSSIADLNTNWKDLYDYKIGFVHTYSSSLELRLGYTYSTPVSDKNTTGPTFATPSNYQHIGLGLGKTINNTEYNVSVEHYESSGSGSTEEGNITSTATTKSITGTSRTNVNALLMGIKHRF